MYTCIQTSIQSLLRELSGPRPLRRDVDIASKPRIWDHGASAVSLETRPTSQILGCGKGGSPVYFNPTICWCDFDIQSSSFVGPRDVEVPSY